MKIIQQSFQVHYSFPVVFTHDVFSPENNALLRVLEHSVAKRNRFLIVIDSAVLNATPGLAEKIERYFSCYRSTLEFVTAPLVMKGGEACKADYPEIEKVHAMINKHHLCRHSFILVIGGGAVLDAAGFAAATAHRGIRLIRMPTTTLSQNDAGVGVKNAVNAYGRKNFLGTFAPPFAIINDFDFLRTLPPRIARAGIAEAVKVALIRDREFFDLLYQKRHRLHDLEPECMEQMIIRCAELHMAHIAGEGDPFECGCSRPLDFGHWSAHKMEELTEGAINHGEAVAVGVSLDSLYSYHAGFITELELQKILSTLEDIGFNLCHWALSWINVESALREFQEHLGGELTIPLLQGIGSRIEVHEIDTGLIRKCVTMLSERNRGKEKEHDPGRESNDGPEGLGDVLP